MGHTLVQRLGFGAGIVLAVGSPACAWYAARAVLGMWPAIALATCGALGIVLLLIVPALIARRARIHAEAELAEAGSTIATLEAHCERLAFAKADGDAILDAVSTDLIVIDASFMIASRPASTVGSVFGARDLSGENFLNVLERSLSDRMFATARDYVSLLFDATKKERTLVKVNPLEEVEITVPSEGGATRRYVRFTFHRIATGAAVTRLLVIVEDITERCLRERALRESEQQKVRQFELLLGILYVPPADLDAFSRLVREQLAAMDLALTATDFGSAAVDQTELLRGRLDIVLERLHNIKGNAGLLRLEYFERHAQALEEHFGELRARSSLGGDDFLTAVSGVSAFRVDLDDLAMLRSKLAAIERAARVAGEVGDDLIASVMELAATLAKRAGKSVTIDADGFDSRALAPDRRLAVKDVLVQLTRNAVLHGIETPAERLAAGKSRGGTIEIHPTPGAPADAFSFTFRDDGRGLDAARIRARAYETGLLSETERDALGDSEVARFIFVPGFSTVDGVTPDAGRGMGMNVIKGRIVDDCGGEIAVDSEAGAFCEFSFVLPARVHALAS